jgi:hypothetical protein
MNETAYKGPRDPINAPCNQPLHRPREYSLDPKVRPQECDHQWTDYGTLKSGDNPTIEIEVCVRCGVQRKKEMSDAERLGLVGGRVVKRSTQSQKWTPDWLRQTVGGHHPLEMKLREICRLHEAELNAERDAKMVWAKSCQKLQKQLAAAERKIKELLCGKEDK